MLPNADQVNRLGQPQISLAGFQIWIHGRERPDSDDYWDGNWLRVTAHCGGQGASVWATGSILHLPELAGWRDQTAQMHLTLAGTACLDCMEPSLSVELKMQNLGQLVMTVRLTPEHLTQQHLFEFSVDQSYLPAFLRQCNQVLDEYSVHGLQKA
jgi:hypothetical protein